MAQLGHGWCQITTNSAFVEMGGGFYHFGYRLERDERASTPATNVWHLFLAREQSPDKSLMTLPMATTRHVTAADLEKLVGANFNQEIQNGNSEGYWSQIILELRFGHTIEAAKTCEDWMKARPESWLARLAYAHLRCRLGESDAAAAQFTQWIETHKNFPYCVYLALFNYREGRTNQAVQAVRMALDQPFVEPPGTDGSKFYLAQNAALIAYSDGNYAVCLAMCNKMLAAKDQETWWHRKALRIKAAATFMKGNQNAAVILIEKAREAESRDSFSHEEMAKADLALQNAIVKENTVFVRNFGNWVDEMDTWFSPFETDESEFHGPDLRVPTPYPPSWKTDQMNPNTPQ